MTTHTCSEIEFLLRKKLDVRLEEKLSDQDRIRQLGAFWPHWALHKRKCDSTNTSIISIYSPHCPYPVWNFSHWLEHSDPPKGSDWKQEDSFFTHLWDIFRCCPIPHVSAGQNENAIYADDAWHSKNLYLTHSAVKCQDLKYCYRVYNVTDSQFAVFSFDSQLCADIINCRNCFQLIASIDCRNCSDSSFLYDCRNCSNCLFCWNLRNREYCIENRQLTKEQYIVERARWKLDSRDQYNKAWSKLEKHIFTEGHHRALHVDTCEDVCGDYIEHSKSSNGIFFAHDLHDCVNCVRGGDGIRDALDCVAFDLNISRAYKAVMVSENCYEIRCCFNIANSKYLEYCGYCVRCENCFGCCGLVGRQFCIFNIQYDENEYLHKKATIVERLKAQGTYGDFFPGYFSPNPYEESWAGHHFTLTEEEIVRLGFRVKIKEELRTIDSRPAIEVPDQIKEGWDNLCQVVFWDDVAQKPFAIQKDDINFCIRLGIPLPNEHYVTRLKRNFSWIPFMHLRPSFCCKCRREILTTLSERYSRGLCCEECYSTIY